MNRELITSDQLVHLCVLETKIPVVNSEEERSKVCMKMCEYAKDDGVNIINTHNENFCGSCDVEMRKSMLYPPQ